MFAHGITVTVHRGGGVDRFGDPIGDETVHEVAGCGFAPETSRELTDRRETVTTPATLYAPPGVDLRATDKVTVPGEGTFHVIGKAARWSSPFTGWTPGVAVSLEEVTG
ncbi:hypothetical protein [Saccharopolyspora sp. 6V]|uniref:hypothetical protein n=1 Tax=Saccharopolyspora sp. 6V TaxID=2877239 RepID=UPI001CD283DA|nr:hypothetical protein [Saccharopolyspora sp. 6V]MCA1191619.1 hypothetical protein [Saccharopolyspora sp. 6V]